LVSNFNQTPRLVTLPYFLLLPAPYLSRREHQASGAGIEEHETFIALAWLNCVQLTDFFFKRLSNN